MYYIYMYLTKVEVDVEVEVYYPKVTTMGVKTHIRYLLNSSVGGGVIVTFILFREK